MKISVTNDYEDRNSSMPLHTSTMILHFLSMFWIMINIYIAYTCKPLYNNHIH